jgi:hypothetical protein
LYKNLGEHESRDMVVVAAEPSSMPVTTRTIVSLPTPIPPSLSVPTSTSISMNYSPPATRDQQQQQQQSQGSSLVSWNSTRNNHIDNYGYHRSTANETRTRNDTIPTPLMQGNSLLPSFTNGRMQIESVSSDTITTSSVASPTPLSSSRMQIQTFEVNQSPEVVIVDHPSHYANERLTYTELRTLLDNIRCDASMFQNVGRDRIFVVELHQVGPKLYFNVEKKKANAAKDIVDKKDKASCQYRWMLCFLLLHFY